MSQTDHIGSPAGHCGSPGGGRVTHWEVTWHPSSCDRGKILSPEQCSYRLKENESSKQKISTRPPDTASKESVEPTCIWSDPGAVYFLPIPGILPKNVLTQKPLFHHFQQELKNTFSRDSTLSSAQKQPN